MCGIVGLIAKTSFGFYNSHADLFTNMLRMDSIRGEDSTGVFGVTKEGKLDYVKGDADGYKFVQCEDYAKFRQRLMHDYKVVVGHNRKATKGSVSAPNAHPFVQEHICLVHNGTIINSKELNREVEVDSHAIAHALAEHDAPAALKKLNGPFALVWFDKKDNTLSMARNDQRTLFLIEYETFWAISSEVGLVFWLQGRDGIQCKSHKIIPTDKILTFNLNKLDEAPKEIEYEKYKYYTNVHVSKSYPSTNYDKQYPVVRQLRQRNNGVLLDLNKVSNLKAGDVIKFKACSYKDDTEADRCLLGNPIFGDTIDGNLTVQAILPKGETVQNYLALGDVFTATIMNIRPMGGRTVVFAHTPVVCHVVRDFHGVESPVKETIEALKLGCGRCFKDMWFKDVDKSVVQQRKDGSWRLLCPACVQHSIQQAKSSKTLILPAAEHVQ